MKWTVLGLIVIGVVAALCAALLVASLQAGGNRASRSDDGEPTEIDILVATRDLPAISVVDANAVAARTVKAGEAPYGAITSPVKVIGQVLVAPVVEGQAFTDNLLATNSPGMHLSATLPEGMRAMSVIVSTASAVGGWLYPGCLVDVVAAVRVPGSRGTASADVLSTVLLQGVEVLAVGPQSIVSSEEKISEQVKDNRKEVVTLMVDAKQAESLHLAAVQGDITLTLRNPLDNSATQDRGLRLAELSGENPEGDRVAAIEALPPLFPGGGEGEAPSLTPRTGPSAMVTDRDPGPVAVPPGVTVTDHVQEAEGPYWRMLVIRGKKRQVLEFSETEPY